MSDKMRVQFDFSPESYKDLETLQADISATTKADTVRAGLWCLKWLIAQHREGKTFVVVARNGKESEVMFPFLQSVKPKTR